MIGKGKVDSILKYNAIGFDMDHTFLQYKMRNLISLINQAASIYLISKNNYPQEIFPLNDDDLKTKYKMWSRVVFDHKTGNLLKIGGNNLIMRGYHGWKALTKQEVQTTYGKNPIIQGFEVLSSKNKDFTNLHEFYGASIVPLIAQIVDLKQTNKFDELNKKTYYEIMDDINQANNFNYGITNPIEFENNNYHGFFFPKLLTEPRRYIRKTNRSLIDKLIALKNHGIKIFFVSNNYFEVANKLMTEAMDKNWLDLFDFVVFDAKKPGFFKNEDKQANFLNLKSEIITDFIPYFSGSLKGMNKVMLNGNANIINKYLIENVRKEYKVLFFGDTIVTDCIYAFDKHSNRNWDIVFIMEELQELENGFSDKEYYGYWKYWGSAILDKNIFSGVDKTIIFEFADNVAHRSFSKMNSADCLEFMTI